ncbi:MAG: hypothetical protein MUO50_15285 [Longimicrobiales bacterium]|nr:hypothetical protein [Longimicrobiales bacterium]
MRHSLPRFSLGQKDWLRTIGFGLGYLPTAVIPAGSDRWLIEHLTDLALRLGPGKVDRLAERMARSLGARGVGRDFSDDARSQYEMILEGAWGRVRSLHKRGWAPQVSIDGLERIRQGQAAGHGTILWRMSLGSTLIVKRALFEADIGLVHLSMEKHGAWSDSWIARKALCPLYCRTESWYLRERVIIPWNGATGGVMKTLLTRLGKENAVVSIVGDIRGTQNITTPFLDGQAEFAIGSPSLAWKAKSVLLPVFSVREGTGRYRVVIDAPISTDRDMERKEFVQRAVEEFSERMQDAIAQYPGSWEHWGKFWSRGSIFRDAPSGEIPAEGL